MVVDPTRLTNLRMAAMEKITWIGMSPIIARLYASGLVPPNKMGK